MGKVASLDRSRLRLVRSLWLVAGAMSVHELEEWNIARWSARNFTNPTGISDSWPFRRSHWWQSETPFSKGRCRGTMPSFRQSFWSSFAAKEGSLLPTGFASGRSFLGACHDFQRARTAPPCWISSWGLVVMSNGLLIANIVAVPWVAIAIQRLL